MDCPKCKSAHHVKDGIVGGRQRYQCKDCCYRYTVACKSDVKPLKTRRLALDLYLAGLSVRRIGKILKISYGTVYVWVKGWGSQIALLRGVTPVKITPLEKMLHHVESKKTALQHRMLLIDLDDNMSFLSVNTS
jgi:transposase-like protein